MQHILISRTDAIGDVVLTLPVCGLIKKFFPACKISFLGNTYTREIIAASRFVDNFIDYNEWTDDQKAIDEIRSLQADTIIHIFPKGRIALLAQKAGITTRIGTTNRPYHWLFCNKLIKLSRKNSSLHESQLNIKLLKGLKIDIHPSIQEISEFYGLDKVEKLSSEYEELLSKDKFNLIIHPKSSGSAKEWPIECFSKLIDLLDEDKYKIFISGSAAEKELLTNWLERQGNKVTDITGMFNLAQFISFISKADGLLAASTGPIHIAAATGINALGMYPNNLSINARRWGPVGKKATYIEATSNDMGSITAKEVFDRITKWTK